MTNGQVKAEIMQIYGVLSPSKQQALDMAIKALEQEPKTDVLDKIRAEIEEIAINRQVDEHTSFIRTGEQVKQMALNIIDKYRGEES